MMMTNIAVSIAVALTDGKRRCSGEARAMTSVDQGEQEEPQGVCLARYSLVPVAASRGHISIALHRN